MASEHRRRKSLQHRNDHKTGNRAVNSVWAPLPAPEAKWYILYWGHAFPQIVIVD